MASTHWLTDRCERLVLSLGRFQLEWTTSSHSSLGNAAHTASGGNWVLSTVLTQQWVEDEMRGRVFSTDMLLLSLGQVISTISAGYLVEHDYVNLQQGILAYACLMIFSDASSHLGILRAQLVFPNWWNEVQSFIRFFVNDVQLQY